MMERQHILIIDDDPDIRSLLADFLEKNGFATSQAHDGRQMFEILDSKSIDLLVLDLNLPDVDGLELCKQVRMKADLPIIMVTAKTSPIDRVVGLESGADDYICKPFEPLELVSRVRSVLRRTSSKQDRKIISIEDATKISFSNWVLDTKARHLIDSNHTIISISGAEFKLLMTFIQQANKVLNRDYLMDMLHGRDAGPFDRSIDLQISRLRQKIEADPKTPLIIKTVRNEGYVFTPTVKLTDE
jgi:two-component system, OmpR family, response regulator